MGEAVAIVKIDETGSFTLDEEALSDILNQESIKDKPVCIVSVAGGFRKGKSFLLDFFLRYLTYYDQNPSNSGSSNSWLGSPDTPLQGFHWRGGANRDTKGILMWSKVFVFKLPRTNREVAVVLMDTQGAFDSSSTVQDCATIFALSAMMSSCLVYNLTANIGEDDLQHLQLFTEYGRLALEDCEEKPFQKLQFLIRDWCYPYETEFGSDGGDKFVQERLEINDKQHEKLQILRKHIRSCFSQIKGFLMPHPGMKVAMDPKFDGKLQDIEPIFVEHLSAFVPLILSPDNLVIKKISGNQVKCKEVLNFFRAYIDIFKGDEMPEPKSVLDATSEANNVTSMSEAKETYINLMEAVCGGKKPYISEHVLDIEHCRIRDQATTVFTSRRKMGGDQFSQSYRDQLEGDIEELYKKYKDHNESKNIFKAANTPITLGAVFMGMYMLSQVFHLIGLSVISGLLNLVMTITFLLLGAWSYTKYSGTGAEIGEKIDEISLQLWESGLQPAFSRLAEEGVQYAARNAVERVNSVEKKKQQ